jgi:hypothetical protein
MNDFSTYSPGKSKSADSEKERGTPPTAARFYKAKIEKRPTQKPNTQIEKPDRTHNGLANKRRG